MNSYGRLGNGGGRDWVAEADRFFVDGQHDTARLAQDAVGCAGWVNDEIASVGAAVLVDLRAGEHDNMLEARVFMEWYPTADAEAQERGGRA